MALASIFSFTLLLKTPPTAPSGAPIAAPATPPTIAAFFASSSLCPLALAKAYSYPAFTVASPAAPATSPTIALPTLLLARTPATFPAGRAI